MEQPWARFHPSSGRLVAMEAKAGRMRVPEQAIESGRLEEDVRIEIYDAGVEQADLDRTRPAITILADVAEYDASLGEIRSPRRVEVLTDEATFVGEDLRIVFDEDGERIERLTVARALEPIRLRPETRASTTPRGRRPRGRRDGIGRRTGRGRGRSAVHADAGVRTAGGRPDSAPRRPSVGRRTKRPSVPRTSTDSSSRTTSSSNGWPSATMETSPAVRFGAIGSSRRSCWEKGDRAPKSRCATHPRRLALGRAGVPSRPLASDLDLDRSDRPGGCRRGRG